MIAVCESHEIFRETSPVFLRFTTDWYIAFIVNCFRTTLSKKQASGEHCRCATINLLQAFLSAMFAARLLQTFTMQMSVFLFMAIVWKTRRKVIALTMASGDASVMTPHSEYS